MEVIELEVEVIDAAEYDEWNARLEAQMDDYEYDEDYEYDDDSYDEYDDSMDGDEASALASAGFGTDEDYGCYDSGDW